MFRRFVIAALVIFSSPVWAGWDFLKSTTEQEKIYFIESKIDFANLGTEESEDWVASVVKGKLSQLEGTSTIKQVYAPRLNDPTGGRYLVGVLVRVKTNNLTQLMMQFGSDSRMNFVEIETLQETVEDAKAQLKQEIATGPSQIDKGLLQQGFGGNRLPIATRMGRFFQLILEHQHRKQQAQLAGLRSPAPLSHDQLVAYAIKTENLTAEAFALFEGLKQMTSESDLTSTKKFLNRWIRDAYVQRFIDVRESDRPSLAEMRFTFLGYASHFKAYFGNEARRIERVKQALAISGVNHAFAFPALSVSEPHERREIAQAIVNSWMRSSDLVQEELLALTDPRIAGLADAKGTQQMRSPLETARGWYALGAIETLELLQLKAESLPANSALRNTLQTLGPKLITRLHLLIQGSTADKPDLLVVSRLDYLRQRLNPAGEACLPVLRVDR